MISFKPLRTALAVAAFMGASIAAHAGPTLWLSTGADELATVDVATGGTSVVGTTSVFMTDIAFNTVGDLYGISFSNLYSIDKTNANTTLIGSLGSFNGTANALVFGADGTLYMAGSTLYKVNVSTGAVTAVGSGIGFQSAGDLAFVGSTLFMAASNGDLVSIDTSTGVGTSIGTMGSGSVFGLATPDNTTLYGVDGQNVVQINTSTGAATFVSTFNPTLGFAAGSAFLTESGATVPEPGALALAGVALFGAAAARRRQQA